jgi:hypothetical protein
MTDKFYILRKMSCRTLSLWVKYPSIWVSVPPIPNMRLLMRRCMIHLSPLCEFQRPKHLSIQDTSALTVKPNQETHTTRLSLDECLVNVDIFYFIWETVIFILVYSKDCSYFLYFKWNLFLLFTIWNWATANV